MVSTGQLSPTAPHFSFSEMLTKRDNSLASRQRIQLRIIALSERSS